MMIDEDGESKQETVKVGKCAGEANRMHLPNNPIWGGKKEVGTAMEECAFHMGRFLTAFYLY